MHIHLTKPQSEFFTSTAEYVAAVAGLGSGKTKVAVDSIMATKIKYPTVDLAYYAPTYPLIRDIFYPKVSAWLDEAGMRYKINKAENTVHVHGLGVIYCRTMENPELIVGYEVGDAFMDEFDVIRPDKADIVLNKVSARCRQKFPDGKKNQKKITTTPEGFKATYKYFVKEKLPDSHLVQMSTYSNEANLPAGYIESLIAQYPSNLIEAYLHGRFINLTSGSVYSYFDRKQHHTDDVVKVGEPLHIGMDFNVHNMAAIVHNEAGNAIGELVGYSDTPAMIEGIRSKYEGHRIFVYPDASGGNASSKGATLTDISLLTDAKFLVRAKKANPRVAERVLVANKRFENNEALVNTELCPELTNALEQQIYDRSGAPDKLAGLDHVTDAYGYHTINRFPIRRQTFATGTKRYR